MSRRADAARALLAWLTRGGLLALWALVGWGTLLVVVTTAAALGHGPGAALDRLLPGPSSGPWGWLNAASAALAVAAWIVLAGFLILARWGPDGPTAHPADGSPPSPPPEDPPTTP